MSAPTTTYVRATVTVEFPVHGTWGDDCKLDQVKKQATEAARNKIEQDIGSLCRILDLRITAVLVVEDEKAVRR